MPLPFTYTELLEACPPMLHASHGTMGVIDPHHIVVVGCRITETGHIAGSPSWIHRRVRPPCITVRLGGVPPNTRDIPTMVDIGC